MSVEKEIKGLLQEGAKYYGGKDYESAIACYSETNALYEATNGKPNPDYLFLYGRSLYQNALAQSDVLGVGGGEASSTNGGDAEESEEGEASVERGQLSKDKYKRFQFAEEEEEDAEEEEERDEEIDDEQEEGKDEDKQDGEGGNVDDGSQGAEEDEEAANDFEAAWVVLEIARSMYEEAVKTDPENDTLLTKLSETYDILGEISLESENFQQAAEDFTLCLKIREQLYQNNDTCHRLIIEAHYKISLAMEFDAARVDECKQHLSTSVKLLNRLIEEGKSQEDDKELLDELKLKRKELDAPTTSGTAALEQQMHEQLALAAMGGKVNDLTSVVRKRKSREQPTAKDETGDVKKSKA